MGQVFRLLKAHQNRERVELDALDPTGDLDAMATCDDAHGDICVSLINRSPERALDVELRFSRPISRPIAGEQASGTLLSATDFLPGSRFAESPLDTQLAGDAGMCVTLPPHSVALLQVAESS
jgi:hypothetical protein